LSFVAPTHIYFITVDDNGDTYQVGGVGGGGGSVREAGQGCIPVFSDGWWLKDKRRCR